MSFLEDRAKMLDFMHECSFCVLCIRIERMVSAYDSIKRITASITEIVADCPEIMGDIAPILTKLISSQQSGNMSKLADILETELGVLIEQSIYKLDEREPFENISYYDKNKEALIKTGQADFVNLLEKKTGGSEDIEAIVTVARSGDIAFAVMDKVTENISYLTGLNNPYSDALQYVFYNMTDESTGYLMVGAGMIYEAMAMIRGCVGVPVTVVESDVDLSKAVLTYIDLSDVICSGRLSFLADNCETAIAKAITDRSLLSRGDTVKHVDENKKAVINKYRAIGPLAKENIQLLNFNFFKNKENNDPYITEITDQIKGKEVYLVAGGPSLSPGLPLLKNKSEDSVVLCVGTSARKLMSNGIIPDYVTLIDGLMSTRIQMECEFDYTRTSFLYLSTACYESVKMFNGKRYIAYQEGFAPAEKMAQELHLPLFRSGGSVSTFALDVAVTLRAKKITCLGLDLAYTYDQLHASGIHEGNDIEQSESNLSVRSTTGEMITTAAGLDTYRKWIENYLDNRIDCPDIVNISDGAYIHGMKNITVHEAL